MWLISRLRDQRYCAFCRTLRRVYVKKHIDLTNVGFAIATAMSTSYLFWDGPDPRGLIVFCLFIAGAEIFVYTRWRSTILCKLCGFDPVLYKKSPARASLRVKEFFKDQVENPEFWLTKSPLLAVQKRIRAQEKKSLERQIIANRTKSSSLAPTKSL
jgi:hypothetical protein